jgi:ubiquinone/menaquinone biosynthesis C-methylase UbiE
MSKMPKPSNNFLSTEIDPAFALRAQAILTAAKLLRPQTVLDVGCGRGFYLKHLIDIPGLKLISGIDVNERYLKIARKYLKDPRINLSVGSVYHLPYPAEHFDLVICSEVLEHLSHDRQALLEINRVLKPKGYLLITVPHLNFPFWWDPPNWLLMHLFRTHLPSQIWWLAGIWADHLRLYSLENIKALITQSGFLLESQKPLLSHCWPFTHFLLYGLGKNLVENGYLNQFNRFNPAVKKSPLASYVAHFMRLPDEAWPEKNPQRFLNLFIQVQKSH